MQPLAVAQGDRYLGFPTIARFLPLKLIRQQYLERAEKQRRYVTARDFGGYTLDHLKKMYPTSWRNAADHFGVEVPEEEREQ